jgi:hypothetical protein
MTSFTGITSTLYAHVDVLTYLLDQPNELIAEVVQWLDLKDLLNLRLTSHTLHELVHSHEEGIYVRYCQRLRRAHPLIHLPVTLNDGRNDLLRYIELQRRYEPLRQLSLTISDHIASRIQIRTALRDKQAEGDWRHRKQIRLHIGLLPWLFALNSWFEALKVIVLEAEKDFACFDDDTYLSMTDVFNLDQQRIIEDWVPSSHENIGKVMSVYAIIEAFLKLNKLNLTSRSSRYPFASLKKILIYCGLMPLNALLAYSTTNDAKRRQELAAASEKTLVGNNGKSVMQMSERLPTIHHLDTQRLENSMVQPSRRIGARNRFIDQQDVWDKAASTVVRRNGENRDRPTRTIEWLKELLAEENDLQYDLEAWE